MTCLDVKLLNPVHQCSCSAFAYLTLLMLNPSALAQSGQHASEPPRLDVAVDPRVELLSIVFRLAGNPEYNQGRVASYVDDVEEYFGRFRDHEAVKLAANLRRTRGVSFDACMSMAVHLENAYTPKAGGSFDPLPESLDRRWGVEGAGRFLREIRRFVVDTAFREFFETHRPLYELAESRMQKVLAENAHLEWFDDFFGGRSQATFKFTLGMLNGGGSYGPRYLDPDGDEELYCILGVWKTDSDGMPVFDKEMLDTVIHEFCHSYTNGIVDRHEAQLESAGKKIFPYVEEAMKRQAYGNWKTMMYESMVRACVIRYVHTHVGPEAARRAIANEKARSFAWIEGLSELLGEYEVRREEFADLDAYFPRIVDFFTAYADEFAEEQSRLLPRVTSTLGEYGQKLVEQFVLAAARPGIVSITPSNGALDADPDIEQIKVVFDRPMADGSWSMVGGGPNFPEIVGEPSYDATRTVWSVSVKLKPAWSYRFMLNSDRFKAFKSQQGVPLAPVVITFNTAKKKPEEATDSSRSP